MQNIPIQGGGRVPGKRREEGSLTLTAFLELTRITVPKARQREGEGEGASRDRRPSSPATFPSEQSDEIEFS